MLVHTCFVDWPEITFRQENGRLTPEFWNTGLEEGWIEDPSSWPDDSSIFYEAIAAAWRTITQELDAKNRAHSVESFDLIFGRYPKYELVHEMECWFMAVSPETVSSISTNISSLDFSDIESTFAKHSDELDLDYIEDYETGLYPYLMQWKAAIDDAKKMRWGLLGHYG